MTPSTDPAPPISASVMRNRDPILKVLRELLVSDDNVLEVASGSGAHAVHFASRLQEVTWQPTELDAAAIDAMAAHFAVLGLTNLRQPLQLDAGSRNWPDIQADAIVAINMIHISPWSSTEGLMAGANHVLKTGGLLFLYGPFVENGVQTAASNLEFDHSLKRRNNAWGLRNLSDVEKLACSAGLVLGSRIEMPANNLSIVFQRL